MKKKIVLLDVLFFFGVLLFLIFCCSTIYASPFLICDPQTNVTSYIVDINGTVEEVPAQDLGNNTSRLHLDLDGLADGDYSCSVKQRTFGGSQKPSLFRSAKQVRHVPLFWTFLHSDFLPG